MNRLISKFALSCLVLFLSLFPINSNASVGDILYTFGNEATLVAVRGVDVDSNGRIYVAEYYGGVIVFNQDGTVSRNYDYYNARTATTAIRVDQSGDIYSTSYSGGTQIFNTDGVQVGHIPVSSHWPSSYNASDSSGLIYVTSPDENKVVVFNGSGNRISEWGSAGSGEGEFSAPAGIGIGPNGLVYVVDSGNNRIQVFDRDGNFISAWGTYGVNIGTSNPGQFNMPMGLDISTDGKIAVADMHNGRIQVFDLSGNPLGVIPVGVWTVDAAIDDEGKIYAATQGGALIRIYSPDGILLDDSIGRPNDKDGSFNRPAGVAVDSSGKIWVADSGNHRIQVLDPAGNFLWKFGTYGSSDGQFKSPLDVDFDSQGNIYVIDSGNHRIQVFDPAGNFQRSIGSYGSGDGQFNAPRCIAIGPDDRIYLTEWRNKRVQVLENDGTYINKWEIPTPPDINIAYAVPSGIVVDDLGNIFVSGYNSTEILVYDINGNIHRSWRVGSGLVSLDLDRHNNVYVTEFSGWRVSVTDPYGNFLARWPAERSFGLFGVAVDQRGRAFVSSTSSHRVTVYEGVDYLGNTPPSLAPIGNKTGNEGQLLKFTVTATDPDEDNLTFAAANLPTGAAFDPATATFSWIPGYDQAGVHADVEFSVADDGDPMEIDAELITINIGNVNQAPVVAPVGSFSVDEFDLVEFTVTASDPDGDSFILYAGLLPTGATFDDITGVFAWMPDATQVGSHTVTFYALDDGDPPQEGQTEVLITVADIPPDEQADDLIDDIIADELPPEVENAYLANLKKVSILVEAGKINAAINQVEAFIHKTGQDLAQGLITQEQADYYLAVANEIINDLLGQ